MNAMQKSRARTFAQGIAKSVQDVTAKSPPLETQQWHFQAVSTDDLAVLTERLMDLQDVFDAEGKQTHVDIAFHYTRHENLAKILTSGLLTRLDRQKAQIHSHYNGSVFGDGVYTCNNPDDFIRYGTVGILVARLQGTLEAVSKKSPRRQQQQQQQQHKWSGDTGYCPTNNGRYAGMRVLRKSSQCLPLVRYDTHAVTQTQAGRRALYQFHCHLQRLVDTVFNGGTTTSVPEYETLAKPKRTPVAAAAVATSNPTNGTVAAATGAQELKKQKETFLLFVRVLIKYLEHKDPHLHRAVEGIIRDCAERNKRGEPGYDSVTASMRTRLKKVVSESYWNRAECYLKHLLRQNRTPPAQTVPGAATATMAPNQGTTTAPTAAKKAPPNQNEGASTVVYVAPECLSTDVIRDRMVLLDSKENPMEECAICIAWLASPAKDKACSTATPSDVTVVAIKGCGHKFHLACIQEALQHNSRCPTCRRMINEPQGTMPSGMMKVSLSTQSCGGYSGTNTFVLSYKLEGGTQKAYHPNPGFTFPRCQRTAYIPDCPEGRQLLKRLKYAFSHGMSFLVGRSLTTGQDNVITWSSIHHKSSMRGGAHGFPDLKYFENCNKELDALGVPKAADLD